MGDMPYAIDKGEPMTFLEDVVNTASDAQAVEFVSRLRNEPNVGLVEIFSETLIHPGEAYRDRHAPDRPDFEDLYPRWYKAIYPNYIELDLHFIDHWYNPVGNFFVTIDDPDGLIEASMKEGLCRAFEASFGMSIDPLQPLAQQQRPTHQPRWPIDVTWFCPAPRFDVSIMWRSNGTSGQVRMSVLTPGIRTGALFKHLDTDPVLIPAGDPAFGQYKLEANQARTFSPEADMDTTPLYDTPWNDGNFRDHRRGSWIIGAKTTELVGYAVKPEPQGKPPFRIFPTIRLSGGAVVVAPAFPSGGVIPN